MGCGSSRVGDSVVTLGSEKKQSSNNVRQNENEIENLESYDSLIKLSPSHDFKQNRKTLIPSLDIFKEVDERALKTEPSLKISLKNLVDYLIKPFENSDLLKLRAIWFWVTHNIEYDVDTYFNAKDEIHNQTHSNNVLTSGSAVCSGYADLIKTMASVANLKIQTVPGWAKGYSYVTGASLHGKDTNHVWNAVYLDSRWWLLDSTWGAGYIDSNRNFIREYNEHYFLTDPKEFIIDHYPEDENWQLLQLPITMKKYESMPQFSRHFFRLNMKPLNHLHGTICSETGKIHMKFKIDKENPLLDCAGKLYKKDETNGNDQYVHVYTTEKILHVLINLPCQGEYVLKLFGQSSNDAEENKHTSLPNLCMYSIMCTKEIDKNIVYPRKFRKWNTGFQLESPKEGQLLVGNTYKFRIGVSAVCDVAVCLGGKKSSWSRLTKTFGNMWEGDVCIDKGTERVNVVAKFKDSKNTSFSSLLEYQVIDQS